jgi:hypothetical protein
MGIHWSLKNRSSVSYSPGLEEAPGIPEGTIERLLITNLFFFQFTDSLQFRTQL